MKFGDSWWSMSVVVPREQRLGDVERADARSDALVERAVEPPPHALEDLQEVARRLGRERGMPNGASPL